jgi:hypothetical protein
MTNMEKKDCNLEVAQLVAQISNSTMEMVIKRISLSKELMMCLNNSSVEETHLLVSLTTMKTTSLEVVLVDKTWDSQACLDNSSISSSNKDQITNKEGIPMPEQWIHLQTKVVSSEMAVLGALGASAKTWDLTMMNSLEEVLVEEVDSSSSLHQLHLEWVEVEAPQLRLKPTLKMDRESLKLRKRL